MLLGRVRQSLRQVLLLMARRPELLCGAVLLGVLLLLAVKFTCSRAKNVVAPARPPVRFFSADAPVVDLYLGQIDQVERLRAVAEVSLIFLYAPWCSHSMAARQEVQLVAKKLAKQVQFVAVNCWWSRGKCRRQNRLFQYPIIHLFYRRVGPIEYKGPFMAPYVESFILKVLTPLTYLPSKDTLQDFLSYHEPRVVGFFQFNSSPQPPGYITFLSSALHALRRDFRGLVRFGVVTSRQVADTLPVTEGAVYLHRKFNSSLVFPRGELNFTSEAICRWVFEHYQTILQWLQPPGTKSRLLEEELSKGPALLQFLPYDPLAPQPSPLLKQVEDVAVRYHSCPVSRPSCCLSLPVSRLSVCELCLSQTRTSQTRMSQDCLPIVPHRAPVPSMGCVSFINYYSSLSHYTACCSPSHLRDQTTEAPPPPPETEAFTGLRCSSNRTLRFYVLDAELNWPLAERLGAPHNHTGPTRGRSFTAIVHLKDEVHYVLQPRPEDTLTQSLEAFILNFSAPYSPLQRHLVGQGQVQSGQSLISEVTSSSFIPTVMDVQQDVLLFYYTQWCGFCSVLHHIIIHLARLLQGHTSITVARVNVDLNDLPWEFMVDRVPTVLLFPRYRKHESVKFPEDLPITLPNLLRFVLLHADSVHTTRGRPSTPPGDTALLRAQVQALQREVEELHRACERLSHQLNQLWRNHRKITMDQRAMEVHNQELMRERSSLEEQHREKSIQLGQAVRRLQELADTSESLLHENTLLRVLLRALRERTEETGEEEEEEENTDSEQRSSDSAS